MTVSRTVAAGAVVFLVAALAACSEEAPDATPEPAETETADCKDLGAQDTPLAGGCWVIRPLGVDAVRARLTLPGGLFGSNPWVWNNPPREDHWAAMTVEAVGGVYRHPCRDGAGRGRTARTVEEFVDDLAAQPVTELTEPTPVTIGGFDGLHVEVTAPTDYDIAACHREELHLWRLPGKPTTLWDGHVKRLWVLDVDDRPFVLSLATTTDSTRSTVEKFSGILTSAELQAS